MALWDGLFIFASCVVDVLVSFGSHVNFSLDTDAKSLFTPRLAVMCLLRCASFFSASPYLHCTKAKRVGQRGKHNETQIDAGSLGVKRSLRLRLT